MQFKNFFFLACLLATTFLGANTISSISIDPASTTSECGICDLPAPTNFHVEATGPTWINFVWTPSNALNAHRIRIFRVSDNSLLSTTIVPPGIMNATISVPASTQTRAEINTICEDGSNSFNVAIVFPMPGLILDLVLQGYHPSYLPEICSLRVAGERCYFLLDASATFRVQTRGYSGFSRGFSMTKYSTYSSFQLHTGGPNGFPQYFNIKADFQDPEQFEKTEYEILLSSGTVIARFDAGMASGQPFLGCLYMNPNYEIVLQTSNAQSSPPGDNRDAFYGEPEQPASASPNPFSELLDVFPGNASAESIHLQLFNLSGQKVLDQKFPGGQEQYTLSTAGLSNGFYLLRIEADGEVQTLKVVKSE